MVATLCDEQVAAVAERVNGEGTSVLFTGLFTITPASAGTVRARTKEQARVKERSVFIKGPFAIQRRSRRQASARRTESPFVWQKEAEYVF
jgi:hypothetical protein